MLEDVIVIVGLGLMCLWLARGIWPYKPEPPRKDNVVPIKREKAETKYID